MAKIAPSILSADFANLERDIHNIEKKVPLIQAFAQVFERNITPDAIAYDSINDIMPNTGWNQDTNPSFGRYMVEKPENHLAFALETPYFGEPDGSVVINPDTLEVFGKCFANALREYISCM